MVPAPKTNLQGPLLTSVPCAAQMIRKLGGLKHRLTAECRLCSKYGARNTRNREKFCPENMPYLMGTCVNN